MRNKFAFIGVGNMANAIIGGITGSNDTFIKWNDIVLFDRNAEKMQKGMLTKIIYLLLFLKN